MKTYAKSDSKGLIVKYQVLPTITMGFIAILWVCKSPIYRKLRLKELYNGPRTATKGEVKNHSLGWSIHYPQYSMQTLL